VRPFLDGLPEAEFWVRNLPRKATSLRLQNWKDWPDFLCLLTCGRVGYLHYLHCL
jgi:hypothetical protein